MEKREMVTVCISVLAIAAIVASSPVIEALLNHFGMEYMLIAVCVIGITLAIKDEKNKNKKDRKKLS